MLTHRLWSPLAIMSAAVILVAACLVVVIALALSQPWMGIRLAPVSGQEGVALLSVAPGGPGAAAGMAPGPLVSIARPNDPASRITLEQEDLVEDPGALGTQARIVRFLERQDALHALLDGETVELEFAGTEGVRIVVTPETRPFWTLPPVFWVQIAVGAGGLLIGAWVWGLRRDSWGPRMFALAGAAMLMFSFSAAVYSVRELALARELFQPLAAINHAGAVIFGAAMIGLFISYPRRLAPPFVLGGLMLALAAWLVVAMAVFGGVPSFGNQITMAEMLGIIVAATTQYAANRKGDPRDRAALRWLGLSVVIGAGAFIGLAATPMAFGVTPVLSQGYSFLFFLLIYVGIAFGLRRYRLFELDQWAFRVLFYTGGFVVLIAFDAILIYLLSLGRDFALGLSLLLVGFLYLPLRDLIQRRMVARPRLRDEDLFRAVVEIAFAASPSEGRERWRDLLSRMFAPLEIAVPNAPVTEAGLAEDGLALHMPATAGSPPLVLRHPWGGGGLFGAPHLKLAQHLVSLMRHAEDSRQAYEQGAASERRRIAEDLHDDVGARLLSGLHNSDLSQARDVLRESIADIRTIVSGLSGEKLPLIQVLGDLRFETTQRLEGAGIALEWPPLDPGVVAPDLEYRLYKNLRSALREIVSNIIRHSGAGAVDVAIDLAPEQLRIRISDDGVGVVNGPKSVRSGAGLGNIVRRMEEAGGACVFPRAERGTVVELTLPFAAPHGSVAPA